MLSQILGYLGNYTPDQVTAPDDWAAPESWELPDEVETVEEGAPEAATAPPSDSSAITPEEPADITDEAPQAPEMDNETPDSPGREVEAS